MRRLAALAATLMLSACGSPSQDSPARDRYHVTVAAEMPAATPAAANWQRFVENVKVWAPQHNVTLQGTDRAGPPSGWAAAVQGSSLQVAALPPEAAQALVPELAVLGLPGLFASHEEADYVLDHALFETVRKLFLAHDLVMLEWVGDDWEDPGTRSRYRAGVIVANKAWFDRLTPHDRDVFAHAYGSAGQARTDARAAITTAQEPAPPPDVDEAMRAAQAGQLGSVASQVYQQALQGKQAFAAQQAVPASPD